MIALPLEARDGDRRGPQIGPGDVPVLARGAEGMVVGEDFLVLDGQGQMLRGLNHTGAEVWALVDGRRSARQVAALLAEAHGAPLDQVLPDVLAFLERLRERGLIHLPRAGEKEAL